MRNINIKGKYIVDVLMLSAESGVPEGVGVDGMLDVVFSASNSDICKLEKALFERKYSRLGFFRYTWEHGKVMWSKRIYKKISHSDNIDKDVETAVNEIRKKIENLISEIKDDFEEAIEAIETVKNMVTELNIKYETKSEFGITW